MESQFVLRCCTSQGVIDGDYLCCYCFAFVFLLNGNGPFCPFYICEFKLICIRQGSSITHSQILLPWRSSQRPPALSPKNKSKKNKKKTTSLPFLTPVLKAWFVPFSDIFISWLAIPFSMPPSLSFHKLLLPCLFPSSRSKTSLHFFFFQEMSYNIYWVSWLNFSLFDMWMRLSVCICYSSVFQSIFVCVQEGEKVCFTAYVLWERMCVLVYDPARLKVCDRMHAGEGECVCAHVQLLPFTYMFMHILVCLCNVCMCISLQEHAFVSTSACVCLHLHAYVCVFDKVAGWQIWHTSSSFP